MIRVTLREEPEDFDVKVRQPGLSALAELTGQPPTVRRRGPRIKQRAERLEDLTSDDLREYAYWTRCLPQLHERYAGICAYACCYIEPVTGPTVDHFVAISRAEPQAAYEWANYRLASSLMNARKRDFPDVLDPMGIEDGWFVLNFGTLEVEPGPGLASELEARVRATIDRLSLNSPECISSRRSYVLGYFSPEIAGEPLPFWFIRRQHPFIARELVRQNLCRP